MTEAQPAEAGAGAVTHGGPRQDTPVLRRLIARLLPANVGPVAFIAVIILAVWYPAAVLMNADLQKDVYARGDINWTMSRLVADSLNQERPLLPAPHQILGEMNATIFGKNITSKRSLVYHAWVTLSSTLPGFVIGALLGIGLAVGIVYVRALDKSLMPWVISSQTIPILAIAPMVIVVLGAIGLTGLLPKAIIATYLCFFPVTIGMVKGLRAPDPLHLDLMRTYSADRWQTFRMLRLPASVPYLFTSLKVAIAASLVGAIVGELPTGAQAGLGARLLVGSYYGQTIQIWAALLTAALVAATLVGLVGVVERLTLRKMAMER